jgi:hypothetical protein
MLKKYRKNTILILILILISSFIVNGQGIFLKKDFKNIFYLNSSKSDKQTVLIEYFTDTTNSVSSLVSSQLYSLFTSEKYDFYYITYLTDLNIDGKNRAIDLEINRYPSVVLDGGYKIISGKQDNISSYINAIDECYERKKRSVEIYLSACLDFSPCYKFFRINAEIINLEYISYSGRLFISVVKINSEYEDYNKRPFDYVFLDYAYDENIYIDPAPLGKYEVEEINWFPNIGCSTHSAPDFLLIAFIISNDTGFVDDVIVTRVVPGEQPSKPYTPIGKTKGKIGETYPYKTKSFDYDGNCIKYGWDWNGDLHVDEWTAFYNSGIETVINHTWEKSGLFNIRVKARNNKGFDSYWSDFHPFIVDKKNLFILRFLSYRVGNVFEKMQI